MGREIFVDTSGLYALVDRRDPHRLTAERHVKRLIKVGGTLVLSDYILDEAATLAKARAGGSAALRLLEIVERSAGFQMLWIGEERFNAAKAYFRKYADHGYSFSDCTSFILMRELEISDALTADHHFVEAGFRALLRE